MPTPLDYERFGLSLDRFGQQQDQFGQTMDFRQQQADRTYDYRAEHDEALMAHRQQQAQAARQLALMRMLPKIPRAQMAQQYLADPGPQSDRQTEWNTYAADYNAAKMAENSAPQAAPLPAQGLGFRIGNEAYLPGQSVPVTMQGSAAEQDNTFAHLTQQNQMQRIQDRGAGLAQRMAAMQAADARQRRTKEVGEQLSGFEKNFGFNPGLLATSAYDEKAGMVTLPGAYVKGPDEKLIPRQIPVPAGVVGPARNALAVSQGYDDYHGMQMADPAFAKQDAARTFNDGLEGIARKLGARAEVVVPRALALGKQMGLDETGLQDLVQQLAQQDLKHQVAIRHTGLHQRAQRDETNRMDYEARRAGEQAATAYEDVPWWQKLPQYRGMTPLSF